MDPQATWNDLTDAWCEGDWDKVLECASALQEWIEGIWVPPDTVPGKKMGSLWDKVLVRATCDFAGSLAKQVIDSEDGIPRSVPFSVSCFECDAATPDSYEEAVSEGWTQIVFRPEGLAENFMGCCPEHKDEE